MIVTTPTQVDAGEKNLTVADPTTTYKTMIPLWKKSRAVCNGEKAVKEYDNIIDNINFSNLLIPFSPTMSQLQYDWYKSEAELPGIVAQYAKVIVGGLLRKKPTLELPDGAPEDAATWIMDHFSQDSTPLVNFLDGALWEEMQTSRAWIFVDYPAIPEATKEDMVQQDYDNFKPYPVMYKAESVINYYVGKSSEDGSQKLKFIIVRGYEEVFEEGKYHPSLKDTVWVHELDENEEYCVTKYVKKEDASAQVSQGKVQQNYNDSAAGFEPEDPIYPEMNGKRMNMIPAWPLNGSFEPQEPILTALINREISLYNKLSRRNHLLYGASTYTPYIATDMQDDEFERIVNSGLGSWFKIKQNDKAGVLETPTAALTDMDRAITATLEEMAKMGIRMLSPEVEQSGVALEIRNAAQTAQLGTLNTKVSYQLADIIAFMINWKYGTEYKSTDIKFKLSDDFNPAPLGADWLRLITEWYQNGLIPRSIWLSIMKQNDIVPPEYDDKEGQKEINADEQVVTPREDMNFQAKMQQQLAAQKAGQSVPAKPAGK